MGGTITIKTPMAASNIEMPPNIAGLREAQTTVSFHSHGCVSTSSIGPPQQGQRQLAGDAVLPAFSACPWRIPNRF